MRKNTLRTLATLMIAMTVMGFAGILQVHATNGALVFVDPKDNIFPPPYLGVGDTFKVNVTIANMSGLCGLEFKLYWNTTLLNCTGQRENLFNTTVPAGEEDNINRIKFEYNNTAGRAWYAFTYYDLDRALNGGYAPINITQAEYPPDGKLAACTYTFKILKVPSMAEGFVKCALDLDEVKPGDKNADPISHTVIDGFYRLNWSPPVIKPYFSVDPPSYEATSVGEVFNISVKVNNLHSGWEAVGFEFKLGFNGTILEVLNIYEGPWLPPYGVLPNGGTLFMPVIASDHVLVGDVVLPDGGGVWNAPPCFPSGSGVLAIITFNATMQGLFPETLSCALDLYDMKVGNWLAQSIALDPGVDGFYSMRPKVLGRMIDLYIGSDGYTDVPTPYPDPYGGQGINRTADLIYPQKKIWMWAYVTYNEWPEQRKVVTFEVRDPQGEIVIVLSALTNESGIAFASFRIPWPEYEWALCNVFTIVASVDIASNTVKDWLWFHYDYVVRIDVVTTNKVSYKHCEYINVTVTIKSKAYLTYPVVITIVLKDELQYPFGMIYIRLVVGGAQWCTYKYYKVSVLIHVHKHVRAGIATIHVNALSELPWYCGSAWCPEYVDERDKPPEINILAEWV